MLLPDVVYCTRSITDCDDTIVKLCSMQLGRVSVYSVYVCRWRKLEGRDRTLVDVAARVSLTKVESASRLRRGDGATSYDTPETKRRGKSNRHSLPPCVAEGVVFK